MDLGIRGKTALIGASAGGLGLATAERLAMEGCHLALCDINEDALVDARERVRAVRGDIRVVALRVDLTSADSVHSLFNVTARELGSIDILVTNSGGPPPGDFDAADDARWTGAFALTFLSAVRLIREVLPGMKERRWGRIINFTSRAIKEPIPNLVLSNGMRLAVAGMAKSLAREVAPFGITVNNICPGPTMTDRAVQLAQGRADKTGGSVDEELKAIADRIPRGRLAQPEEQAAAVAFLASELAGHVTGISLFVDGGETAAL